MKVVAIPSIAVAVVVLCLALANSRVDSLTLLGAFTGLGTVLTNTLNEVTATVKNLGYQLNYEIARNLLTIEYANGQTDDVGTISLPLNTLCQIPGFEDYATCFVCNNDCIYVHNTYGGTCGPNPTTPGNFTCLCADNQEDATARGISKDSKATCNATYYPPNYSKYIVDGLLSQVLRARMEVLQCLEVKDLPTTGYNSTGCAADCTKNHGYTSGVCNTATPKVGSRAYFNQEQPAFCTCGNSTTEATTTTTTTTTSTPAPTQ